MQVNLTQCDSTFIFPQDKTYMLIVKITKTKNSPNDLKPGARVHIFLHIYSLLNMTKECILCTYNKSPLKLPPSQSRSSVWDVNLVAYLASNIKTKLQTQNHYNKIRVSQQKFNMYINLKVLSFEH